MTEPTEAPSQNPNRPAHYRVVKGSILKGRTVTTPYVTPEELRFLEHALRSASRGRMPLPFMRKSPPTTWGTRK